MRQIYLDHASTTPVRPEVVEAMTPYFTEHFGNPSSIYPLGQEASDAVAAARESLAGLIGAAPARDLLHRAGAPRSDNWAIKGFARANAAKGTPHHHRAPLSTTPCCTPARRWRREGFEVTYLPVDEHGLVSVEDVQGGHPPGHHPGLHHVRQQRDRHHRACSPRLASGCPRSGRRSSTPTRCRPSAHDAHRRERAGHRHAVGLFGHKIHGPKGVGALVHAPVA